MKVTILEEAVEETELVVRCASAQAEEVRELLRIVVGLDSKIPAKQQDEIVFLCPEEVLYAEYVERAVYLYTRKAVFPAGIPLSRLEKEFPGFFRCSKSMVVNLHQILRLKSGDGGRVIATLRNGERILISRHYASALRHELSMKSKKRGIV